LKKAIIIGLLCFLNVVTLKAQELDLGSCTLYDLEGKEVRLSDYKGKPLVLWFWTTWCPYCRIAIPQLNSIYPELKFSGIELIAVNVDESKEKINRFLKIYPIDFKILRDTDARCAFSYGIIGMPTYLLINRKGEPQFKQSYFPEDDYKKLLLN